MRADGEQAPTTLYFLFGHLFHATGEGTYGDDAVISALSWMSGEFDFDARAKLPADETVKASIPELIERASEVAGSRQAQRPVAPPPQMAPRPVVEPPRQPARQAVSRQAPPPPPAPQPVASNGWTPPAEVAASNDVGHRQSRPRTGLAQGIKYRPTPKRGREPIPVPQGQVVYDSLKSSFVDFPRLVQTLEREGYTGYVRLLTDMASGLIFFREGQALECVYDRGDAETIEQGSRALRSFQEDVTGGAGVLDVVSLSPELVDGLYQLTAAEPLYTDLYASWVDPRALLEFLSNRGLNGTVTVRSSDGVGVMILADGDLAGAYTSESREISDRADGVLTLCDDPEAMIEVKTARGARGGRLDVEQVIGGARSGAPGPFSSNRPAAGPPPMERLPAARPQPVPMQQSAPPATSHSTRAVQQPPRPAGIDWEAMVGDLQQATDEALGNRSRKVKDILAAADRTQAGIEAAIDQIPQISILFVDTARLEQLAGELRARLYTNLQ